MVCLPFFVVDTWAIHTSIICTKGRCRRCILKLFQVKVDNHERNMVKSSFIDVKHRSFWHLNTLIQNQILTMRWTKSTKQHLHNNKLNCVCYFSEHLCVSACIVFFFFTLYFVVLTRHSPGVHHTICHTSKLMNDLIKMFHPLRHTRSL